MKSKLELYKRPAAHVGGQKITNRCGEEYKSLWSHESRFLRRTKSTFITVQQVNNGCYSESKDSDCGFKSAAGHTFHRLFSSLAASCGFPF